MRKIVFYNSIAVLIVILFLSLMFAGGVHAGQGYFGAGFHSGTYDEGWVDVNTTGFTVKGGGYIANNFAIEARFLYGWGDWSIVHLEGSILSVFIKGDIPLGEGAWLYGLLGFSHLWLEASALGYSVTDDDESLSYGAGLEFEVAKELRLGVEFIMYGENDYYDYTGFNIMITKLF